MIFRSKYRRRIEIAKLKATIKLREIDQDMIYCEQRELPHYKELKSCLKAQISLLDALLKGKEVNF